MEVSERDVINVTNGSGGKDGEVYLVPMKLIRLRSGRRVLHPEGPITPKGLRIPARKVKRKRTP